mmetsp:Transcript_20437/g.43599  ORF Transcript_20437/g.43599 Transcript_20437/m.43599 type:complete len:87 (+) Transcript_20437:256-516(+)
MHTLLHLGSLARSLVCSLPVNLHYDLILHTTPLPQVFDDKDQSLESQKWEAQVYEDEYGHEVRDVDTKLRRAFAKMSRKILTLELL